MHTRADSDLVQEALSGKHNAFGRLVHRYMDAVYGLALSRTQDFHHSQDLTQEAFIEAYVNLHRLKDRTKFPNWLFGITSNLCNRWMVRRRRMLSLDELERDGVDVLAVDRMSDRSRSSRPDEEYARKEIREIVRRSIWKLPEKTREAMILFYIDGYSYNDLAAFLGVSVGAVRGRLEYGREKLKGELVGMVEEELKAGKPDADVAGRITEQIEELWGNLLRALPPDLLEVVGMSHEERQHRNREIFGNLEASLSAEQKAKMKAQGHLKMEDFTEDQREVMRKGVHFSWACQILVRPAWVENFDLITVELRDYDAPSMTEIHGKRFIQFRIEENRLQIGPIEE